MSCQRCTNKSVLVFLTETAICYEGMELSKCLTAYNEQSHLRQITLFIFIPSSVLILKFANLD